MNSINWETEVKNLNTLIKKGVDSKADIDSYISRMQGKVLGKNGTKMLLLLRKLYMAEGGKLNIFQVNVKNMNIKMKCCLPFTYLYNTGYFVNTTVRSKSSTKTNIDKKFQVIIKALLRFHTNKDVFLSEMYQKSKALAEALTEPEQWMLAMIEYHGDTMVEYFEKCTQNLIETYMKELDTASQWEKLDKLKFHPGPTATISILRAILHDVFSLPSSKAAKNASLQLPEATEDVPQAKRQKLSPRKRQLADLASHSLTIPQPAQPAPVTNPDFANNNKPFDWLMDMIAKQPQSSKDSLELMPAQNSDSFFDSIEKLLAKPVGTRASGSGYNTPISSHTTHMPDIQGWNNEHRLPYSMDPPRHQFAQEPPAWSYSRNPDYRYSSGYDTNSHGY
ncbi:hypothetical protein GGI07_000488 [Coemansia sp. Benny D115]|nr:hypothetical protein GGI07_000488 [Coemansia sp. Benny D115]